jgi:hypothetical protein
MRLIFSALYRHLWLSALLMFSVVPLPADAETKRPLPSHLQSCVEAAIEELILIDGSNKSEVWRLFNKHTDTEWLGAVTYKRAWKQADVWWKQEGVRQYFEFLFGNSKQVSGGAGLVDGSVKSWLPTKKPERGGDGQNGYWHIVFSANLDNGTNVTGAALVTDYCKFFDLAVGGTWISGQMSATLVDAALK